MGRLLEKWVAGYDLLASRADTDQSGTHADELLNALDIVATGLGQRVPCTASSDVF